jgi:hypothetical protein
MWRHQNGREAREIDLRPGVALTIPVGTSFQFRDTGREPLAAVGVTMPPWPGEGEAIDTNGPWTPKYSPQGVVEAVLARAGLLMLRSSPVERATPGWVRDPSRNGEHRDGLPSTFPPPDAEPRGTGRSGQGRRAAAEADGEPFAHVTGDGRGQVGAGRDPRGGGSATCKIAGIAYSGSHPVQQSGLPGQTLHRSGAPRPRGHPQCRPGRAGVRILGGRLRDRESNLVRGQGLVQPE